MSILTANINFLASLGITTSEQFTAAFGDMAAFTEYCDEIGYSWEIGENNELILITPNGNTVNTYIEVEEQTATPTITVTPGLTAYTIEATGEGTVKLYIDGTEVSNPVSIDRTTESQEITITATAQEEGKSISDEAEEEITIPALDTTAAPDIDYIAGLDSYDIVATGDGTVKLYLGANEVANPYTVVRTDQNQTLTFSATAQEAGKQISETTTEEFVIPALPVSTTPTITATQRDDDYLITVTAGQDAVINVTCDGVAKVNPFTVERGNADKSVTIIATATEPHHSMATTSQNVTILALPVTATPTISYTQGLTAYTITATGNGTVLLYADGVVTQNPCSISRTTTAQTITFTATAQETGKQISATATEVINIPAMEVTPTPVITYDSTTFTVDVTGNGTVLAYVDGVQTQMPHTFTQGASDVTYVVTATAQETGKQISATATENCLVPAAAMKDYMKIESLHQGSEPLTFKIPSTVDSTLATSFSYSTDGTNWNTVTVDNTAQVINIATLNYGDVVYLKGIAKQWAYNQIGPNSSSFDFGGGAYDTKVSGNIMSMLYGDNFENQTTFPSGSQYTFNLLLSSIGLVDASQLELPATTLAEGCYGSLLSSMKLTSAPSTLPATTLAKNCYSQMFSSCTSLTTAPALPATTLANSCYSRMFSGCTSLTAAPELPATTLVTGCYSNMFRNCSSLTSAPTLPATTLKLYCYSNIFQGCSNLNSITMLAEDISAQGCLDNWVSSVASTGTFTKAASQTSLPTGASGIPDGWTVVDYGVIPNYMKLSVLNESGNDGNITITIPADVDSSKATSLSYSKDGSNWTDTAVDNTAQTITIPVNTGDEVYLKGVANRWAYNNRSAYTSINSTANINASGNAMSLLYGDDFEDKTSFPVNSTYNLCGLFNSNAHLMDASQLELPATTLAPYCYHSMFRHCTNLTTAPSLPATTLAPYCYDNMFCDCWRMASAPSLPATTLAPDCYSGMFRGCEALTTAPALPATTLAPNCYGSDQAGTATNGGMFQGCIGLTTAPALPATTLAASCYLGMFENCTSLVTAPELPAATLTNYCYLEMFKGCRNLNSITMLAEDISATYCLSSWVSNVAATGTFTKSANMTTLPTGDSGIPSGWTVVDA